MSNFTSQHNAAVYAAARRLDPNITPREFALSHPEHDSICYGDAECWDRHEQWERDHPNGEISEEEQKSMDQYDAERHYFERGETPPTEPLGPIERDLKFARDYGRPPGPFKDYIAQNYSVQSENAGGSGDFEFDLGATQAEEWDPQADGLCKVCGYNDLNDDTRKTGICEHCAPYRAYCFPNGMLMVFNVHGEQVPEYQGRIEENLQRLLNDYPNVIANVATYDGTSPTPIQVVRNE